MARKKQETQSGESSEGFEVQTHPAVVEQLDQKTANDVARQEQPKPTEKPVAASNALDQALAEVEAKLSKFKNHIQGVELFKDSERLPQKTAHERHIRGAILSRIQEFIFRIQNGPAVPVIGANEVAGLPGLNNNAVKAERLELESRSNPSLKEVLEENEKLKKQLESKAE